MSPKRFTGAFRDTWWIAALTVVGAIPIWIFFEPWIACFMPPFAVVTILYFAIFRYDDEGHEREDL